MFRKIAAYVLVAVQIFLIPLSYAYPVLTYLGPDVGMYFSPEPHEASLPPTGDHKVYFHVYMGIKPSDSYIEKLRTTAKAINPDFDVRLLAANVGQQAGKYRVLMGPVARGKITKTGQALKARRIDYFPIYFMDKTLSPVPPLTLPHSARDEEEGQVFQYSDVLTPLARRLAGVETTTDLKARVRDHMRGEAQRYAQSFARQWLSQYGTAKVELLLDKHFNPDSGEVDLLLPWGVREEGAKTSTWFVQPGFVVNSSNYYEGRNFAHIGLGYRAKNQRLFYGLNAFYDYDTTRHHQRVSAGVEYGLSHLKVVGNVYYPLSKWKERQDPVPSLESWIMEARPARGVDVDVTGYLPNFPWLSLSANYQKFFGQLIEVSTGGAPVKDPYQMDVALNYQPISLLTCSVGYNKEKGGEKGLTAGVELTYVFGVPFEKQIDPGEVTVSQSLDARLFKLAERDHNIRMEYRKKGMNFTFRFNQSQYQVVEGSNTNLWQWLTISNPFEIASISFSGTAVTGLPAGCGILSAAQGDIYHAPPFLNPISLATNHYSLIATARLTNGEVMTTPPIGIMVEPSEIFASLTEQGSPVMADGQAFVLITATVEDRNQQPMPGQTVTFPPVANLVITDEGSPVTDDNGQVSKKVTSTVAGSYAVQAEFHNQSKAVDVVFGDQPSPPPGEIALLVESGGPALADGTDVITVTATLRNANDNPVEGQEITFNPVTGLHISPQSGTTDDYGQVITRIATTRAGTYTVIVESNGQSRSTDVQFNANVATTNITDNYSSMVQTGSPALATGSTPVIVTVTLKDAYGNPVPDQSVTFPPVTDLTITPRGSATDANGQISATVTSTRAGSYSVMASLNDHTRSVLVVFTADAATAVLSSVSETGSPVVANGSAAITATATVHDGHGNPLPDQAVTFPAVADLIIIPSQQKTDVNGEISATITSTRADTYAVTATLGSSSQSTNIIFAAGPPHGVTLAPVEDPVVADNTDTANVTATVVDVNNNPVSGATVLFSVPANCSATLGTPSGNTNALGQYTSTISGSRIGQVTVTATVVVSGSPTGLVATTDVTFESGIPAHVALTAMTTPVAANGSATQDVIATVTDINGRPVNNAPVTLSLPSGIPSNAAVNLAAGRVNTNSSGVAQTTLTAKAGGVYSVMAVIPTTGTNIISTTGLLAFTNVPVLTISPPVGTLYTGFSYKLATVVRNLAGDPLPGEPVSFSVANGPNGISFEGTPDMGANWQISNALGEVDAYLQAIHTGTYTIDVYTSASAHASTTLTFLANDNTADIVGYNTTMTETGSPALANGTAKIAVTVTLRNINYNSISNAAITFPPVAGLNISALGTETNSSGEITANVTSTKAGNYNLIAEYRGKQRFIGIVFNPDTATASMTNSHSSVTAVGSPALANGNDTIVVTATLTDSNGNPVPGEAVTFPVVDGLTIHQSTSTTDAYGQVMATVQSSLADSYNVAASYQGQTRSAAVVFTADVQSADLNNAHSSLVVSGSPAAASGTAAVTVIATLKDGHGNPVSGQTVTFLPVAGLNVTQQSTTTNASGQVVASVTSVKADTYQVTARYQGQSRSVSVAFDADLATANLNNAQSSLSLLGSPALADGTAAATVTATLKDANGNPVSGQTITFPPVSGVTITPVASTTDTNGQISATVTSTTAGTYTINANYLAHSRSVNVVFVTTAPTTTMSGLVASGSPAAADGTAAISIVASVENSGTGTPVAGETVDFLPVPGLTITGAGGATDANGQTGITVTSTRAGSYTMTAEYLGKTRTVNIMFDAGAGKTVTLVPITSDLEADNTSTRNITATVTDVDGNPVPGVAVAFSVPTNAGATLGSARVTTDSTGQATTTIKGSQVGTVVVTAALTDGGSPPSDSTNVVFVAGPPATVTVTGPSSQLYADPTTTGQITALVKDSQSRPVSGAVVTFTAPANSGTLMSSTEEPTDAAGEAVVTVRSLTVGQVTVQVAVSGIPGVTGQAMVDFVAGPPDSITLAGLGSGGVMADGTHTHAATATVLDGHGRPVVGVPVNFSVGGSYVTLAATRATTNANGEAATTLTALAGGIYPVTATVAKADSTSLSTVQEAGFYNIPVVTLELPTEPLQTNEAYCLSAIVKNAAGELYPGVQVNFSMPADSGASFQMNGSGTNAYPVSSSEGLATTTIFATKAGAINITAFTWMPDQQHITLNFTTDTAPHVDWSPPSAFGGDPNAVIPTEEIRSSMPLDF